MAEREKKNQMGILELKNTTMNSTEQFNRRLDTAKGINWKIHRICRLKHGGAKDRKFRKKLRDKGRGKKV